MAHFPPSTMHQCTAWRSHCMDTKQCKHLVTLHSLCCPCCATVSAANHCCTQQTLSELCGCDVCSNPTTWQHRHNQHAQRPLCFSEAPDNKQTSQRPLSWYSLLYGCLADTLNSSTKCSILNKPSWTSLIPTAVSRELLALTLARLQYS